MIKMYKKYYKDPKTENDFIDIANAASVQEFTGALPRPPRSEDEKESYLDILNYSPETIDVFGEKKKR